MFSERGEETCGLEEVMDADEILQNDNDGLDFGSRACWASRQLISNIWEGQ